MKTSARSQFSGAHSGDSSIETHQSPELFQNPPGKLRKLVAAAWKKFAETPFWIELILTMGLIVFVILPLINYYYRHR